MPMGDRLVQSSQVGLTHSRIIAVASGESVLCLLTSGETWQGVAWFGWVRYSRSGLGMGGGRSLWHPPQLPRRLPSVSSILRVVKVDVDRRALCRSRLEPLPSSPTGKPRASMGDTTASYRSCYRQYENK